MDNEQEQNITNIPKKNNGEAVTEKVFPVRGDSCSFPPASPFLEQAKLINSCNFHLCGLGWFNISTAEFAYILELANNGNKKELIEFYGRLSKQRVG